DAVDLPHLQQAGRPHPGGGVFQAGGPVVLIDVGTPAHDDVAAGPGVDLPGDAVQRPGQVGVVGVEEAEDVAGGGGQALVDGVGLAPVPFPDHVQVRVACQDGRRLVGGHAVHDEVFDVGVALGQDALDGAGDE